MSEQKKRAKWYCELCKRGFRTAWNYDQHNEKHHTKLELVFDPVPPPSGGRPTLIKAGRNYINPSTVSCIREVKDGRLYIVKFTDDPNPEFPCWVEPDDIAALLQHFNIVEDGS